METSPNQRIITMIGEFVARADSLLSSSQDFNQTIPPRRWQGQELADMAGFKSPHNIYHMENNGKLPEWYKEERTTNKGYTLDMVVELMRVAGTLPWRSEEEPPVILSFSNFKGGCWKTSTCWHFGSWAASQGYRVLFVDMDPQASLTQSLGFKPDQDISSEQTLGDLLTGDEEITPESVRSRILKSAVPLIDLIPAALGLQQAEWTLAAELNQLGANRAYTAEEKEEAQANIFLSLAIMLQEISSDYDLIVLDGTPTLGIIPLNIIFASHSVIVPVPAQKLDFASTRSFLELLNDSVTLLDKHFGDHISLPEPWFVVTKYDTGMATSESEALLESFIKPTFGDRLMDTVIYSHKKAVDIGSFFSRTMFDVSANMLSVRKESRERCMDNFHNLGTEIMEKAVFPHWPEKAKISQIKKELKNGN